jgi:hypothetical protein
MPWWARRRYFPPQELALLKNWEEKIAILAERSLQEDIRMISGVPAWLLIFFDHLTNMNRAAEKTIDSLYRNLEMVVHGGVNFAPYANRFQGLLQNTRAELREVYPASEGFIAIADRGRGEGLRLNIDVGIFFEFVPLEELSSSSPTRHTIATVVPNVQYAVVLTTCAGLWSYIIGDTVRFIDVTTPRLLVTGRTSYYLSAFGEHLTGEEIDAGILEASRAINADVGDFAVGAVYPTKQGELGGHVYVVEFVKEVPPVAKISHFAEALDKTLCARNEDYDAHRAKGFGLKPPVVQAMPPGGFAAWMKQRGKLGGQNKVPRIITDQALLAQLLEVASDSSDNKP